jgi:transposase InsO family protein
MGQAPKILSINQHQLKKARRIGHFLLFEVVVPQLDEELLHSLQVTAEFLGDLPLGHCLGCQPLHGSAAPLHELAVDEQQLLFQYFRWTLAQNIPVIVPALVVVGRTIDKTKASIIVHDGTHVYCLETAEPNVFQFPTCPCELGGTPAAAAVKAFDVFSGPSLRKRSGNIVGLPVMPIAAQQIRTAVENMVQLATVNDTIYFSCFVPGLLDFLSAFWASRMKVNGFRLTPTLAKRHPGFAIVNHKFARGRLRPIDDLVAFEMLLANAASVAVASVLEQSEKRSLSQHSGAIAPLPSTSEQTSPIPPSLLPVDVDEEVDRLFEAAVLLRYSQLVRDQPASNDEPKAAESLAAAACGSDTLGTPLKSAAPTVDEVRSEQLRHPVTSELLDYLLTGEVSNSIASCSSEQDRQALRTRSVGYHLNMDGLLCRWSGSPKNPRNTQGQSVELVVLPPRLRNKILYHYHDRLGHLGVKKVLKIVQQRFVWGNADIMRKTIQEYIRTCDACQRSKIHTHIAGEQQIGNCGSRPGEIWCGDVYYVGLSEDGYDHTLDFADLFSRRIRSEPLQGVPTSEIIADVLIRAVIRNSGVPDEIRSDAGSNFISKAIELLYTRMGVKITSGTAYHHQLVALVERWHRTLKQLIRVHNLARQNTDEGSGWGSRWYRCIPLMELAYNITVNESTGYSPFFLEHLWHPRMACDLRRSSPSDLPPKLDTWVQDRLDDLAVSFDASSMSLRWNAVSAKRRYDLRRDVATWFKPGDEVVIVRGQVADKNGIYPKAATPMMGPFTVRKALPYDRYQIADLHTRRIRDEIHVSRLQPYFRRDPDSNSSRWMVNDGPDGGRWPVHSIVGRRVVTLDRADRELGLSKGDKVLQYRLRYVGFGAEDCRWRPLQYLTNILGLVNEYDALKARPAEFAEKVEVVERPETPIPRPEAAAVERHRFRSHPHPGEERPALDGVATIPEIGTPLEQVIDNTQSPNDSDAQKYLDSLQRLPEQARVRVYYPKDDQHWLGTVTKSWIPRFRTPGKTPAHYVNIRYDDPAYPDEYTHDVSQSSIDLITDDEAAPSTENIENTDKLSRRLQRLQQQLA